MILKIVMHHEKEKNIKVNIKTPMILSVENTNWMGKKCINTNCLGVLGEMSEGGYGSDGCL